MSNVPINKSSLKQQRDQLTLYRRFLPSLDLKRQQLLAEQKAAQKELAKSEHDKDALSRSLRGLMHPLGASEAELSGLVAIEAVVIDEENLVGAKLPVIRDVRFHTRHHSTLATPFWVDFLVEALREMATIQVQLQVRRERLRRLDLQVRRITQRVNLFEKVLIPRAEDFIKRIRIGLSEEERSAVVRSKLAKKKSHSSAGCR